MKTNQRPSHRTFRTLTTIGLAASLAGCGANGDRPGEGGNDAPPTQMREPGFGGEGLPLPGDVTTPPLPEGVPDPCEQLTCGGQTCSDGICNALSWSEQLHGDYDGTVGGVAIAPDGDVLVVGSFTGQIETLDGAIASTAGPDVFVARLTWAGEQRWVKRFGEHGVQRGTSIDVSDDGLIAIGGELEGDVGGDGIVATAAAGTDGFVAVLDGDGNLRWATTFGDAIGSDGTPVSDEHQTVSAVGFTPDGSVVAGGSFYGEVAIGQETYASTGEDSFVVRLDPQGNVVESVAIGGDGDERLTALEADANGGVVVGGAFSGGLELAGQHQAQGGEDVFVAVFDAETALSWSHRYGSPESERLTGLSLDDNGDLVITGSFTRQLLIGPDATVPLAGQGSGDGFVARLRHDDGTYVSSRAFGGPQWERPTAVSVHADRLAIVGSFIGTFDFDAGSMTSVDEDVFVGVLDDDLKGTWSHRYGAGGIQNATAVTHADDGAVIFVGTYEQGIDLGEGGLTTMGSARGVFVASVVP